MNLYTLLDNAARRFPQRGAVYRGTELVCTYAQLRARALGMAAGLRGSGRAGHRIAVISENCPQYVEILFGIWAAGAVAVPVNAKLHPRETAQILEDAGASLVLASDRIAADIAPPHQVLQIGSPAYEAFLQAAEEPLLETAPESLAWLFYTSGTTGRSKGAMLSHRNLMAMTLAHLADIETIGENDSQLHAAPMSHGSGLYIPAYVSRGARQVIPASGGFEPQEFLDLCCVHPGCGAFLAPTMVQRLRLEAERGGRRPTQLRSIVYGGGPMYVEEIRRSLAVFGQVFAQIYGQGESPMTITGLGRQDHQRDDDAILGSVGLARTGCEVAIVDGEGKPLPADGVGEIVCRGDVVMAGYWNNAEGTRQALRGGWLYTGDMGSMDAAGYLTLRDRSKDVVISGGSNIYPREVEEVLLGAPGVREVCVVGRRDDEWGEIVVAFVVRELGADVTPQLLDRHCLARIARFKRPRQYHFVDALPKNNYGKVLKRELRERLARPGA